MIMTKTQTTKNTDTLTIEEIETMTMELNSAIKEARTDHANAFLADYDRPYAELTEEQKRIQNATLCLERRTDKDTVVHYFHGVHKSACGRRIYWQQLTWNVERVTCKTCKNTRAYHKAYVDMVCRKKRQATAPLDIMATLAPDNAPLDIMATLAPDNAPLLTSEIITSTLELDAIHSKLDYLQDGMEIFKSQADAIHNSTLACESLIEASEQELTRLLEENSADLDVAYSDVISTANDAFCTMHSLLQRAISLLEFSLIGISLVCLLVCSYVLFLILNS
jgi:hypothetical protein